MTTASIWGARAREGISEEQGGTEPASRGWDPRDDLGARHRWALNGKMVTPTSTRRGFTPYTNRAILLHKLNSFGRLHRVAQDVRWFRVGAPVKSPAPRQRPSTRTATSAEPDIVRPDSSGQGLPKPARRPGASRSGEGQPSHNRRRGRRDKADHSSTAGGSRTDRLVRTGNDPRAHFVEPERARATTSRANEERRREAMRDLIDPTVGAIFFLLVGAAALVLMDRWRRRGAAEFALREFAEFGELDRELAGAAESGRPIHIALGNGALGSGDTVASLAGLQVLESLVDAAAARDAAPIVTVGDPTLVPLAQDALRRAYDRRGSPDRYDATQVRLVAPEPVAFAAGAHPVGAPEDITGTVAAGTYGLEVSLIAHGSTQREVVQWAGVDSAQAIGAMYPATHRLALGEELYALGSQTTRKDKYSKSLIAEDVLRLAVVLAIVGATAWALIAG